MENLLSTVFVFIEQDFEQFQITNLKKIIFSRLILTCFFDNLAFLMT